MVLRSFVFFALLAGCAPEDPVIESPLLNRRSQSALQEDFLTLFGTSDHLKPLQLPLMVADFNLEAVKILEFVTNLESEIQRYRTELERETRGERANRSILCRDIQLVASSENQKRYVVTYDCNGRSNLMRNEMRGQEIYQLEFNEDKLTAVSMETLPGFETRILRYFSSDDRSTMGGVSANLIENRRFQALSLDGIIFKYNYSQFADFDQSFRHAPKNYKDGYTDKGVLRIQAQGEVRMEVAGAARRFFARELKSQPLSRGARVGSLTIKADRQSIDRGRLPVNRFYILSAQISLPESLEVNFNNCADFKGKFNSEMRWLSGKPFGDNQFKGQLVMNEKDVVFQALTRADSEQALQLTYSECYGRSPVLPLLLRNKFFLF
jgi:hypothetical protein